MRPIRNRRRRARENRDIEGSETVDEPDEEEGMTGEEDVLTDDEDWIRAQEF